MIALATLQLILHIIYALSSCTGRERSSQPHRAVVHGTEIPELLTFLDVELKKAYTQLSIRYALSFMAG